MKDKKCIKPSTTKLNLTGTVKLSRWSMMDEKVSWPLLLLLNNSDCLYYSNIQANNFHIVYWKTDI